MRAFFSVRMPPETYGERPVVSPMRIVLTGSFGFVATFHAVTWGGGEGQCRVNL